MSNYKNNVLNDNPVSFWTFDYDNQVLVGNEIIDEIGNANPLFVAGTEYSLKELSLNDLEVIDQYSITISETQKANGVWTSSTTLECPHATVYQMEDFSVEMLFNKKSADMIRDAGEIGQYQTIRSPLIRKTGLLSVNIIDAYAGLDTIVAQVHDHALEHKSSTLRPVFDINNHLVVKYKVEQVDINEYKTTASMYLNGYMVDTSTINYFDSYPIASGTTSWLLASNGGSDPLLDYQTEYLKLDQIAIYDYALEDEQISTHYRKTQRFEELIRLDKPEHYFRFDEQPSISKEVFNSINLSYNGRFYGNYIKYESSTDKIIDSHSAFMNNGGVCLIGDTSPSWNNPQFIRTSSNYTVEFWFKSSHLKRGLLLSAMGEIPNWNGLNIYLNSNNDFETLGSIQVSESRDVKFNSELSNFNDGKWHHLVVKRSGNWIKLYLDGDLQGSLESAPLANTNTQLVYLFGQAPNNLGIDGNITELAFYNYALQDIQINSRWHFATRHYVFGHTLLEGAPVSAKVRFYHTHTGEKVGEVVSTQGSGAYTYYTYSNRQLDLVALIPDNPTTRYRIHAPITPTEFDDSHLQSI